MKYAVTLRDWMILTFLALVWGGSFVFIKKAVGIFDPLQLAFWRVSMSSVICSPFFLLYRNQINLKKWPSYIVVALCGSCIPSIFFALAQKYIDSSIAGILNALTPLFTLLLGVLMFKSPVNIHKTIGVLLGLTGAGILIGLDPDQSTAHGQTHWWAAGLCILATVCYAISATTVGKSLQNTHPMAISAAAFTLMAPCFFVALWWSGGIERALTHPQAIEGLAYILFLSAVGTVIASSLYFGLIQRTGALFATSVTYLLPMVSVLFGVLDNEKIYLSDIIGSGVILTALYLAKK